MNFICVCKTGMAIVSILVPIHFLPILCEPLFAKYWQGRLSPTVVEEVVEPEQQFEQPRKPVEQSEWCNYVSAAMERDDPDLTLSDRSHYVQECQ